MSTEESRPRCGSGTARPRCRSPRGQSAAAAASLRRLAATTRSPRTCTPRPRPRCLPAEAVLASLGCGNPTALAELHEGEVVLDLGSGGGIDVLLSARRVGPTGKAYGLDMTDEMLALARENQRKAGRRERRVPQGRDRGDPAARRLGGRDHLQLRDQPVGRQAEGARARRSGCSSRAAGSPCRTWWSGARCRPQVRRAWSCGSAAWPAR